MNKSTLFLLTIFSIINFSCCAMEEAKNNKRFQYFLYRDKNYCGVYKTLRKDNEPTLSQQLFEFNLAITGLNSDIKRSTKKESQKLEDIKK